MAFTGKATYAGAVGAQLMELAEDVSDIISIVSPYETPLLNHLGDPKRWATSTAHEWIEDDILPKQDTLNQTTFSPSATTATALTTTNTGRFKVGDQVRPGQSREVMAVTAIGTNSITVVRGYGGTTATTLTNAMTLYILGNAALEGDDRPTPLFAARVRKRNYTQIFTAAVEVSGTMRATRPYGTHDELDYQKQERIRELVRDLENSVINGIAPSANQLGNASTRRTMNGIIASIVTNNFTPGTGTIPAGGGSGTDLNEAVLNAAIKTVWDKSAGQVDTIVVGGAMKRRINQFATALRKFSPQDTVYQDLVSVYESDFGVCRVVMSRWLPTDTVLLLDSSRIDVLPLAGRSFYYKPMAALGDRDSGQVIGEYTLEFRNEIAHAAIRGLT